MITRKEAIKLIDDNTSKASKRIVMNRVYDSFEAMTCENCKHYNYSEYDEQGHCNESVDDGSDYSNYQVADGDVVEEYFGCNKWGAKDEV